MASFIGRWMVARIVRSAAVFENDAIDLYRRLKARDVSGVLEGGLAHLLQEEQLHAKILADTAAGRLQIEDLERILREHRYANLHAIEPLGPEALAEWAEDLERALKAEKDTFVFYSNLRRISKIPAVRKAFEALADMEREHVEILAKLLGRQLT
jgi:hypothetical protein